MTTRPIPDIFLEVQVSYAEMIEVLTKLGYHPEFDGQHNRYIDEQFKSMVILPVNNLDEMVRQDKLLLPLIF